MTFEFWKEVAIDTVIDSIRILPFLLITYLFMEYLEHRTSAKTIGWLKNAGPFGPLVGAITGVVPQCGFSAAASNLYAARVISAGTLLAVFLSTSDEMLPLMLSAKVPVGTIVRILLAKLAVGFIAGLLVDLLLKTVRGEGVIGGALRNGGGSSDTEKEGESAEMDMDEEEDEDHEHDDHHHEHHHHHGNEQIHALCEREHCDCEKDGIFVSAIKHSLKIFLFIFVISFVMNAIMTYRGEEVIKYVTVGWKDYVMIILTSIVGLIPNCAASVAITELYMGGMIGAGALMSGLLVSAGVGLLVLLRVNRPFRDTLKVTAVLWVCGVIAGCLFNMLGITF